jgi:hypothetical protein
MNEWRTIKYEAYERDHAEREKAGGQGMERNL